jgi:hypothetical protein
MISLLTGYNGWVSSSPPSEIPSMDGYSDVWAVNGEIAFDSWPELDFYERTRGIFKKGTN